MLQRFMDYPLIILIFRFLTNQEINLTLDWLSAAIGIQGYILCTTNVYFAVFGGNAFCNSHHQRWRNELLEISKDSDMLIWYVLLLGDMGGPHDKQQLVSQWMDWNASIETVDKVRFREYLVWWWFLRLCLILTKFLFAARTWIGKCLLILISTFRMFLFAFGQNC